MKNKKGPKINIRVKGSLFERKICKILSEWWYQDTKSIIPTPRSGAYESSHFPGDVWDKLGTFIFHVEAKNQEMWSFDEMIKGNEKSPIIKYFEQSLRDSKKDVSFCKIPIVIFTKNHMSDYVCIRKSDVNILSELNGLVIPVEFPQSLTIDTKFGYLQIVSLYYFMEIFKPNKLRAYKTQKPKIYKLLKIDQE